MNERDLLYAVLNHEVPLNLVTNWLDDAFKVSTKQLHMSVGVS